MPCSDGCGPAMAGRSRRPQNCIFVAFRQCKSGGSGGVVGTLTDRWLITDYSTVVMNGSAAEHFGTALHTTSFCGKYIIKCVDGFVPHMNVSSAMKKYGLDCESMAAIIKKEALE